MTTPPYDHTLTDHLQLSAELIALKQSQEERVAWVRFLLTELEPMLPQQAYADLLTQLQELVTTRLSAGQW